MGVWWLHRNVGRWSAQVDRAVLMNVLKTSLPLFAAWIFITLYGNQDRYVMAWLHFSKADIGVYSAAAKLVDALRPVPVLLMGAVFPIVAEAAVKDRALFEKIAGTLVKYSVIGLFPFAFGVTVFSDLIVRIIFGPQFAMTGGILAISIWGYVGIFLNHLFLALLVSSDRQSRFLYGAMISMLVNLPLCWFFFQRTGPAGGAWALIGSESALLIFGIASSPWARHHLATLFGRPVALAALSLGLFWVIRFWVPVPVAFVAAIGLYALLVWRSSLVDISLLRRFVV
jgi:PST family polysaccharide transporter